MQVTMSRPLIDSPVDIGKRLEGAVWLFGDGCLRLPDLLVDPSTAPLTAGHFGRWSWGDLWGGIHPKEPAIQQVIIGEQSVGLVSMLHSSAPMEGGEGSVKAHRAEVSYYAAKALAERPR